MALKEEEARERKGEKEKKKKKSETVSTPAYAIFFTKFYDSLYRTFSAEPSTDFYF